MTPQQKIARRERRVRDSQLRYERMNGATLREIAKRHRLSKSRVHQIVGEVEIMTAPPEYAIVVVQLPGGGYTWGQVLAPPRRHRAYQVRGGRKVYA